MATYNENGVSLLSTIAEESAPTRDTNTTKRRTIVVEPAVFLYCLAFISHITLSKQYVYYKVGREYSVSDNYIQEETQCNAVNETAAEADLRVTIQAAASRWMLYLNVSVLVPQFIMALVLGAYSDRVGRKIIILLSIVGTCLNCISNVIFIYLDLGIKYWILGCIIQGISGGGSSFMSTSLAYIADTVTPVERSFRMTAVTAAYGVSGAVSQIGIGYWIKYNGYVPSFWFISCVHIVNIFYVIFFVPESNEQNTNGNINPFRDLKNAAMLYYKTDESGRNWKLLALLITFALGSMVYSGKDDVVILFALNRPLCWTSINLGYFTATYVLLMTVVGVLGIKLFERCLTDGGMTILAAGLITLMNAFQAFVINTTMMFLVPVIGMFGSIFLPLIQAIMSITVREDEQGAIFAVMGSIETVTVLGSSSLFNMIYADTVHWFSGFVFLVTTGISLSALVMFCIYVSMSGIQLMTSKQRDRIPLLPN